MASKLPTVAIIGQANVGKSSLFNRMVRAQQAIVAREAGTTRDNVIGRVEYDDHNFWLVDTAGLKDPNDEFEASIQEQITEAADSADVILVVVDGSQYPSDKDKFVAKKALRSKKPTILLINKTDIKGCLPDDEFKRLGISKIIRTSAEHNRGIEAALEAIIEHIPAKSEYIPDDILRVALIGRPNVGKSFLFNSLAGKQQAIVANIAGTTRDVNHISVKYGDRDIEILDTAGMRQPGKQEMGVEKFSVLRTLAAIEQSDVCFLLMDANELNTQLDQRIGGIINDAAKGMAIVVTKWDSVEGKDAYTRDDIAPKISNTFDFTPWAPLIFTSAVTGQNVTKLFDLAIDIDSRRKQETKTRVLNDMLDINRMLTDKKFRQETLEYCKDTVVLNFWKYEFGTWSEKFMTEAVAPVLNKVGAFTANPIIRNIIGQPKSTFDIRHIMDEGKILVVNLSKGLIGEDNAAILGSFIVTKIQLAAMTSGTAALPSRAYINPRLAGIVNRFTCSWFARSV